MAKKLGLVLGAGGSRGVAHIGFLKALEEKGITPDFVTGSSMGSVVGSCYCAGYSSDFMKKEILRLKPDHLLDISLNPIGNAALMRSKKIRKKLHSYLHNKTFNDLEIPFSCVAVDIISGSTKVFSGDEKVVDGVIASSSIPGVFRPVEYQNQMLVDGGIKTRLPIDEVKAMGAEVVVAVDVLGDYRAVDKKFKIFSVFLRMIEIYDTELAKNKMANQNVDLLLSPDLGHMSQYQFKQLDMAYQKGYELGIENADKIKQLING